MDKVIQANYNVQRLVPGKLYFIRFGYYKARCVGETLLSPIITNSKDGEVKNESLVLTIQTLSARLKF